MGKHAGNVAGWAMDIGADRKRRAAGRPTYGKHGNGHVGESENMPVAVARNWARAALGSFPMGRHGASVAESHRLIGAAIGRRVVRADKSVDFISAGARWAVYA